MSLEIIEENCLRYLASAKNPLVGFNSLYNRVMDGLDEESRMGELDFRDFVRNHDQMASVEGLSGMPPDEAQEWASVGALGGPRVILKTRIPSPGQLRDMMVEQLDGMLDALRKALQDAEDRSDESSYDMVLDLLSRTEQLRNKLEEAL
jgi:hypothetical protein